MADVVRLKTARAKAKRKLSSYLREAEALLAEQKDIDVDKEKLRQLRVQFQNTHDAYCDALIEEDTEADVIEAQEKYLTDQMALYSDFLTRLNKPQPAEVKAEATVTEKSSLLVNDIKIQPEKFSGEITDFYRFIRVFEQTVDAAEGPAEAKLARLNQLLSGKPREAIKACVILGGEAGYKQALEILKTRYGDQHRITKAVIQDLTHGKQCKRASEVIEFSDNVNSALVTLTQLGGKEELCTQVNIKAISDRLPRNLQDKWRDIVFSLKRTKDRYPNFQEFAGCLSTFAADENDPLYGSQQSQSQSQISHTSMNTDAKDCGKEPYKRPCLKCGNNHRLIMCDEFRDLNIYDKFDFVNAHKLCMLCLNKGHYLRDCRSRYRCGQCKAKHSKLLCRSYCHDDTNVNVACDKRDQCVPTPTHVSLPPSTLNPNAPPVEFVNNAAVSSSMCGVYMPVVKVFVQGKAVYAALDTMSTKTYVARSLVERVRLPAVRTVYRLSRLNSEAEEVESALVSFVMCTEGEVVQVNSALMADTIPCNMPKVNVQGIKHLEPLQGRLCNPDGDIELLIGQDHGHLFYPLEAVRGKVSEPYAIRTVMGWTLHGPKSGVKTARPKFDGISCFFTAASVPMSHEDVSVIKFWDDNGYQDKESHFVLPIPWKKGAPNFPHNLGMVCGRYNSLMKKLEQDDEVCAMYEAAMDKTIKEFAEPVPENKPSSNTWYLPHHHVVHPDKPGKVRVVFNCKAEVGGVSLNNQCLQGPNLVNNIVDVLLNARLEEIVITGDIEAMYNQVRIPPDDRDALRFIWKDQHYRMKVHLFGGVWCAASSTYALCKTAEISDYDEKYKKSVYQDYYVDDWCISVATPEEGIDMVKNVKSLVATAGFNLTKFASNDESVMRALSDEDKSKKGVKEIGKEESTTSKKVLGIRWDIKQDVFYFEIPEFDEQLTRRVMLSQLAGIYDPFGFLAPVIIMGRCILQELNSYGWDDEPPSEVGDKWLEFIRSLCQLRRLVIPRCVKSTSQAVTATELHVFCDGSSRAYGCVIYLRLQFENSTSHVTLLAAKSKIIKPGITIPKVELQAAVLGARMSSQIERSKLVFTKRWYWCDSRVILEWIKQEAKKQEVFVINRTTAIREMTDLECWHDVPTKLNAADVTSRGCSVYELVNNPESLFGPSILRDVNMWPEQSVEEEQEKDITIATVASQHPLDVLIDSTASWFMVKRRLAWLIRVRQRLRSKCKSRGELTVEELQLAEHVLLAHAQSQTYAEKIQSISSQGIVKLSSNIAPLSPRLISGILVVGGRRPEASSRPAIVPKDHPISQRIIYDAHNIAHTGVEWTLGIIRKKYWIPRVRRKIKSLVGACVTCRRHFGKPCVQKMADIHSSRLQVHYPAFSHVGVDLFGPFYVKHGRRSEVKRYVCLFTCMTVRAVHLALITSLEADSFINALRRFVARRGPITCLYSDNATNFRGAQDQLVKALEELKSEKKVCEVLVAQEVKWEFLPAAASHMGGCWERKIRTTRKVMSTILADELTDEILHTVLVEIEAIINGRPLTKVSEDPEDVSALTPSMLLTMKESLLLPPGTFPSQVVFNKRWHHAQHIADQFWRRWLALYLPELERRTKWLRPTNPVKIGDLVLVMSGVLPRNLWPLAVVRGVKVGRDGLV